MACAELLTRAEETALGEAVDAMIGRVRDAVTTFQLSVALREIWDVIGAANRYIVIREPWRLARRPEDRAELNTALATMADTLRVLGELVRPFMPETGERMLRMLGVQPAVHAWLSLRRGDLAAGTRLGDISPLFPRIDATVEELQRMTPEPADPVNPAPPSPAAPSLPLTPERLSIDDFLKIELRVAKVLAAERVPKSTRLLKLLVDVGTEQRTVVAGIAEAYEPEALVGRSVVVVANLKPAKLMGVESNGMVLAASPDGGKPMLLGFEDAPAPGTRVR
jgi:methionyl-tRNA synthetase